MLIAIGGAACGGDPGANGPTPPGTYPVTLTATSGQQLQTLNLTLIVAAESGNWWTGEGGCSYPVYLRPS